MNEQKIIYILSIGHSGSTLLDMTLGQFPDTFSTGELMYLTWQLYREIHGIINEEGMCTCNKKFMECEYWSKILNNISSRLGLDISELPEKFNIKFFQKFSYFDDSLLLKAMRKIVAKYPVWQNLPFFINEVKMIAENNILLYKAIYEETKAKYIIDSSKNILKYKLLKEKIDMFPIILIRDIGNLSTSKYVEKDFNKLKKSWLKFYNDSLFKLIKNKNENEFHILSFERFLDNPFNEIRKIGTKLGLDTSTFSINLPKNKYHLVAGNPMRYNDIIQIRSKKLDLDEYKKNITSSGLSDFYLQYLISQ